MDIQFYGRVMGDRVGLWQRHEKYPLAVDYYMGKA